MATAQTKAELTTSTFLRPVRRHPRNHRRLAQELRALGSFSILFLINDMLFLVLPIAFLGRSTKLCCSVTAMLTIQVLAITAWKLDGKKLSVTEKTSSLP
jgi:hypothetical protein